MNEVENMRRTIVKTLAKLQQLFNPGMKLTFIARNPGFPDQEVVITAVDDDLEAIIAVLERSKARESDIVTEIAVDPVSKLS